MLVLHSNLSRDVALLAGFNTIYWYYSAKLTFLDHL